MSNNTVVGRECWVVWGATLDSMPSRVVGHGKSGPAAWRDAWNHAYTDEDLGDFMVTRVERGWTCVRMVEVQP